MLYVGHDEGVIVNVKRLSSGCGGNNITVIDARGKLIGTHAINTLMNNGGRKVLILDREKLSLILSKATKVDIKLIEEEITDNSTFAVNPPFEGRCSIKVMDVLRNSIGWKAGWIGYKMEIKR